MLSTPVSLLKRLQEDPGDKETWTELVELYHPFIRSWFARQGVQPPDADDLVQEVLLTLVKELPSFERQRTGSFRAWLRVIAGNRLKDWRSKRRKRGESLPDDVEDADSSFERVWDAEHDRHVVGRLLEMIEPEVGAATLLAFRQYVVERQPAEEVARRLGLSVNALYIIKSRVLSRLRELSQGMLD
jgi:RNA polymerase sigma-70 factor (ECF subfamily)